jgi:hypothetical protein
VQIEKAYLDFPLQIPKFWNLSRKHFRIALFEASDDALTVKVAERAEEVKALLEIGFEYVCQKDNLISIVQKRLPNQ